MSGGHWSEQNFIDHVYGLGPRDGHLDVCGDCRARAELNNARRKQVTGAPEVSHEFLAEQRRRIHHRLETQRSPVFRLLPAFGAVLLLLLGFFFLYRPARPPALPGPVSSSDAQLFSDIYALEQTSEPHVATPVEALFQEN
jgi:hypothetical protein